jgi:hypothetical protein
MPLCIQIEAKDMMHAWLHTQTETFSAACIRNFLNSKNNFIEHPGDEVKR